MLAHVPRQLRSGLIYDVRMHVWPRQIGGVLTLVFAPTRSSAVKVREVMKLIEHDGWYLDRTRGSHRQYKHSWKRGLVTVPGKPNDDLAPGTLNSILKQAGLK